MNKATIDLTGSKLSDLFTFCDKYGIIWQGFESKGNKTYAIVVEVE